ncbi:MAG: hypothetical protein AAFP97_02665 [Pseudomonadota bacterium]
MKPVELTKISMSVAVLAIFIAPTLAFAQEVNQMTCYKTALEIVEVTDRLPGLEESFLAARANFDQQSQIISALDQQIAEGETWIGRKRLNPDNPSGYFLSRDRCNYNLLYGLNERRMSANNATPEQVQSVTQNHMKVCRGYTNDQGQYVRGVGYTTQPYILVANADLVAERHYYDSRDDHNTMPAAHVTSFQPTFIKKDPPWTELGAVRGPYKEAKEERARQDSLYRRYQQDARSSSVAYQQAQGAIGEMSEILELCQQQGIPTDRPPEEEKKEGAEKPKDKKKYEERERG